MTSHSEDTMWLCPKCGLQMYRELQEGHMRIHDLSAEPTEAPQAPELDGPA